MPKPNLISFIRDKLKPSLKMATLGQSENFYIKKAPSKKKERVASRKTCFLP